jgi:hypothetical protein
VHRIPHLVIRGISDGGDEKKRKLDKTSKNGWRRYCVRNAATLLMALLEWDGFVEAVGLAEGHDAVGPKRAAVRGLIDAVKRCPGGPWAAGVALGIYNHGPAIVASGNAVPMDVSRLRVTDFRFRVMIERIEACVKPTDSFIVEMAADTVVNAVNKYRKSLACETADALIADFDDVVVHVIFADDERTDDRQELVLAEADRLAEDAGAQAVVDFLKDQTGTGLRVRERYIDALDEIGAAAAIVELALSVGSPNLTRRELEHAMFACGKEGRDDRFDALWTRHVSEFDDAAAEVTRQELIRRFPGFRKLGK